MIRATVIAIEGRDRVGKATQANLLVQHLRACGHKVLKIEVPIKSCVTHPLIYWMLKNGAALRYKTIFQILQFVNKVTFQFTKLLWLQYKYDYIVFDRWSLSALVYGNVAGVNYRLNELFYATLMPPDLTLVIDGTVHDRMQSKDSYEADLAFQKRVAREYVNQSFLKKHISVITLDSSKELIHEHIFNLLEYKGLL